MWGHSTLSWPSPGSTKAACSRHDLHHGDRGATPVQQCPHTVPAVVSAGGSASPGKGAVPAQPQPHSTLHLPGLPALSTPKKSSKLEFLDHVGRLLSEIFKAAAQSSAKGALTMQCHFRPTAAWPHRQITELFLSAIIKGNTEWPLQLLSFMRSKKAIRERVQL